MVAGAQEAGVTGGFGGGRSAYDGPSILGRGGSRTGQRGTEAAPIRVQASINGSYDTNILGYSLDSSGNFAGTGAFGILASVTASGRKVWRRAYLGIDYSGGYDHYFRQTFFNGSNHQLNLSLGRDFGPKWQLNTQLIAGTTNRFLGGQSVFQTSEVEFLSAPTGELFDSRTYIIGNTTSATYSFSRRDSVRFSGTASAVRRRARGLVDLQTYGASSDWVHRFSRRSSMGLSYTFSHYDFTKVFGESDIHMIGWHISRKVGRDWNFGGSLTGAQQSTVGIRNVSLDPVLAAILGRSRGAEVFESNNLIYGYSVDASRRIRRSNLTVRTERGINPGNGYFLTSVNQSTGVSFSHTVSRRFSVNGNFARSKMSSLGFASGVMESWIASTGIVQKLTDSFGLNASYDWRTFDIQGTTFGRTGHRVTVGLSYFPQRGLPGVF